MRSYVVIVGCALLVSAGCSDRTSEEDGGMVSTTRKHALIPEVNPSVTKKDNAANRVVDKRATRVRHSDSLDRLDAPSRALYDKMTKALDEENCGEVIGFARDARGNASAEVRQKAVEALAWFSESLEALETLQQYTTDADEDIAFEAKRRMEENVDLLANDYEKNAFLERTLYRYPNDGEAIDFVCNKLETLDMTPERMTILNKMIYGKVGISCTKGKAAYKFITGETYENPEKANQWVKEHCE